MWALDEALARPTNAAAAASASALATAPAPRRLLIQIAPAKAIKSTNVLARARPAGIPTTREDSAGRPRPPRATEGVEVRIVGGGVNE